LTISTNTFTYGIDAASNKLTGTTGPAPNKTNSYDAVGNLTADGTNGYTYSDRGRLQTATMGPNNFGYLYNALGQRVVKTGPTAQITTGIVHYVYDEAGHLFGEYDGNGKPSQETIYLGDIPVAVLSGQ